MATRKTTQRTAAPRTRESFAASNDRRVEAGRLYPTKNDLPESTRREVIELLNARLADCIDLETQCKQAHWNVKGPSFIALHELFDALATFGRAVRMGIDEMTDLKDADSADVLTEISRGIDKWLWFVEAHQQ